MSDDRLTEDYAALSLLAGFFAAGADIFLGRPQFIQKVRTHAWTLTWEMLATWKAEALALGVPASHMEPSEREWRHIPQLVQAALKLQEVVDRQLKVDE